MVFDLLGALLHEYECGFSGDIESISRFLWMEEYRESLTLIYEAD